MLIIIFTYNREEMLLSLVDELGTHDVIIIDDGSEWLKEGSPNWESVLLYRQIIRTHHEGKKGFWKKWVMARQIALGSGHDYFLFLPDDIKELNLETIEAITKQGWDDNYFAVNVINCNRTECWGYYRTGQEDIEVNGTTLKEVGFVDCGFLTNRTTMELIDVHEVPPEWFDRPDKSSGVGSQMSMSMRMIGAKMMMPFPGLCYYDWKHDSVMHPKPVNDRPVKKRRVINTKRP